MIESIWRCETNLSNQVQKNTLEAGIKRMHSFDPRLEKVNPDTNSEVYKRDPLIQVKSNA